MARPTSGSRRFHATVGCRTSTSVGCGRALGSTLTTTGRMPRAIRYALMTGAHYRSPLAFSPELLKAADSAIKRLDEFAVRLGPVAIDAKPPSEILQRWDGALRDDLNLPAAIGHLFDFIKTF